MTTGLVKYYNMMKYVDIKSYFFEEQITTRVNADNIMLYK